MFRILKGFFSGFYDFLRFSLSLNELNDKVETAEKAEKSKMKELRNYSKWVKPGAAPRSESVSTKATDHGIYGLISKMYFIDLIFILVTLVVIFICSSAWSLFNIYLSDYFEPKWIRFTETFVNVVIQLVWRLLITVMIELINMVHIKKLTRKIHIMLDESKIESKKSNIHGHAKSNQSQIMSRLHTYAFFLVFPFQIIILDWVLPYDILRSISLWLHNSLLYSFYSFDHIWSRENVFFEQRIQKMILYMPYFIGYGSSVGIIQMIWPDPISLGAMLTIFVFPLLVVNAYRVDWIKIHSLHVGKYVTFVGKWFLRPSLWGCQLICCYIDRSFEYFSH